MDNVRGLLAIRRIDNIPNGYVSVYLFNKGVDERINEIFSMTHSLKEWRVCGML